MKISLKELLFSKFGIVGLMEEFSVDYLHFNRDRSIIVSVINHFSSQILEGYYILPSIWINQKGLEH